MSNFVPERALFATPCRRLLLTGRKLMSPEHGVPTTIGRYRDRHSKRIGVRFLDFCYQIFAFGNNAANL